PALFEAPDEIERLVGGNSTADDEQHAFHVILSASKARLLPALHETRNSWRQAILQDAATR
ncbi:MAG TPA: hypothetical protein PLW75_06200, partial [Hyphomicrobium sp.]|nr:hypothetical protein [Hyphomicrobium sp.]